MRFPPAYRHRENRIALVGLALARMLANPLSRVLRGKLKADVLLYSNERTHKLLPARRRGEAVHLVANAVDTAKWCACGRANWDGPPRFITAGRLVDFKAFDLLLEAFARVRASLECRLRIIGDGPLRHRLETQAKELGIANDVEFLGWLGEDDEIREMTKSDAFVFPSLREAGGAVVLEAMALGLPTIAANWGGPADYVVEGTGILVDCSSADGFVQGLVDAMKSLGCSPERRQIMGRRGRLEVETKHDWERRIDFLESLYRTVLQRRGPH
jgi:glycosyltransferase involved in cell wall biosynthesis